jgi:hypothetical protein
MPPRLPDAKFEARLFELFPAFFEAARRLDLAHISLMFQPEHNVVGVVSTAAREGRETPGFETSPPTRWSCVARFRRHV